MDTSSHSFVFEIDTLGDGSSSVLLDVAIIDENNIWAVGEIYLRDSSGQVDPMAYNLARWDASQWGLDRIDFPVCDINGNEIGTTPHPVYAIAAIAPTNIWLTDGGNIVRWDGWSFSRSCLTPGLIDGALLKLWGESSSNLFGVGRGGTIIHFDGMSWKKLESGTKLDFYDVFGSINSTTGELEVFAVAAQQFVSFDKLIVKIDGSTVAPVSDSNIPNSIHGLWFKPGRWYYTVGSGMYTKREISANTPWEWIHAGVTQYYTYAIRGNDLNDVVVCGAFGEFLHFNGVSWESYRTLTSITDGAFYEVAVKNNLVVAVGYESPRAIVLRATR
jgi:hypothetical protein